MADMSSFKTRLTSIIKKSNEQFGNSTDILDFQGISTPLITEALEDIHSQLSELEKRKETYEVILLKRFLDEKISKLKGFFEKTPDPENFNDFLNDIAKIKFRVKETYFLVINDIIRTEAAISKSKDALYAMTAQHEQLKKAQGEILPIIEKIKSDNIEYTNSYQSIKNTIEQAEEIHSEYDSTISSLEKLKEENQKLNNSFKSNLIEAQKHNSTIDSQNQKTQKILKQLTEAEDRNKELRTELDELKNDSTKQNELIYQILADANRASMAGSFKEQMENLSEPLRKAERNKTFALIATFFTLLGIFTNCFGLYAISNNNELFAWATKIAIISPLVWIAWNETRKHNVLSRIKEDYAFKYSSAVAFEGYNRNAGMISQDLQLKLLDIAITNIGLNPVRLFDLQNTHNSPAESIIKDTINQFQKTAKEFGSKTKEQE